MADPSPHISATAPRGTLKPTCCLGQRGAHHPPQATFPACATLHRQIQTSNDASAIRITTSSCLAVFRLLVPKPPPMQEELIMSPQTHTACPSPVGGPVARGGGCRSGLRQPARASLEPLADRRPERVVGRELPVGEACVAHRAPVPASLQPRLDRHPLVREAVRGHHGVLHHLPRDGAEEHRGRDALPHLPPKLAVLPPRALRRLPVRTRGEVPQQANHLDQRRAVPPVVGTALQRKLGKRARVLEGPSCLADGGRINCVVNHTRGAEGSDCVVQCAAVGAARGAPGQQLKQRNAEGVRVARRSKPPGVEVLGVDVVEGSNGRRVNDVRPPGAELGGDPREADVRELCGEVRVEQHVGRLEVAVQDRLRLRLMEHEEGGRHLRRDPDSVLPLEGLAPTAGRGERVLQAPPLHELVDDAPVLGARAEEEHEVRVAHPRQNADLPPERLGALHAVGCEALDGDARVAPQDATEDLAKAACAEPVRGSKAACGLVELLKREHLAGGDRRQIRHRGRGRRGRPARAQLGPLERGPQLLDLLPLTFEQIVPARRSR
mmetsp:Transcript_11741/g.27881  ORF Transcript_11741/g.27881 Transcript_11741/m.27881 type:complete len:552 (-) Transcript_11741:903-2558(-)